MSSLFRFRFDDDIVDNLDLVKVGSRDSTRKLEYT